MKENHITEIGLPISNKCLFAVYYSDHDKIGFRSYFWVLDKQHSSCTVLILKKTDFIPQSEVMSTLQKNFHFSDSWAAQYKKKKNQLNLCLYFHSSWQRELHLFGRDSRISCSQGKPLETLWRPNNYTLWTFQLEQFKRSLYSTPFLHKSGTSWNRELLEILLSKSKTDFGNAMISLIKRIHIILEVEKLLSIDEMASFVTFEHDQSWWLACILSRTLIMKK